MKPECQNKRENTRSGSYFDRLTELAKQLGHVMDRPVQLYSFQ